MGFVNQVGQGLGLIQPDPPPAPDMAAAAMATAAASKDAALYNTQLNRANQVDRYGKTTWTQNPAVAGHAPTWTQTTTLSPQQEAIAQQQDALSKGYVDAASSGLSKVTSALSSPMDVSKLQSYNSGPDAAAFKTTGVDTGQLVSKFDQVDGASAGMAQAGKSSATDALTAQTGPAAQAAAANMSAVNAGPAAQAAVSNVDNVQKALADANIQRSLNTGNVRALPGQIDNTSRMRVEEALMSRLNPQLQRDEASLRTRLLNSGIEVGSEAYNRELNNFAYKQNDARMQAILAAAQEENRQVGLTQGLNAQEYSQALSSGQFGQNADTAMSGLKTQTNLANADAANKIALANADRSTNVNLANTSAINNVNLANANFGNEAAANNAGFTQQANLANAEAVNETGRYNAGLAQQTGLANASASNASSLANAGLATDASLANANNITDVSQFNAALRGKTAESVVNAMLAGTSLNAGVNNQNFNQGTAQASLDNSLRSQQVTEANALRNMPLNELNALRTGGQVTAPNFGNYYTGGLAAGANYLGAAGQQVGANAAEYAGQTAQSQQFGNFLGVGNYLGVKGF